MEKYKSVVVVGSQWGDEGKGKMTDFFAQQAQMVVRFGGGDNAGHIINKDKQKHKLSIVPSGVLNPQVKNIIGNGVVVNLKKLVNELQELEAHKIDTSNVFVSERAHIVFEYHLVEDELEEIRRGPSAIGTTKKGIGPCYADKVARRGIRICDIMDPNFEQRLKQNVDFKNKLFSLVYNAQSLDFKTIYEDTLKYFALLKERIVNCAVLVETAIKNDQTVLFEGAQGVMLDIDHGTYPYVTSSTTSANNASIGSGIPSSLVSNVVGIAKAYCTRVGNGALPTEMDEPTAQIIRTRGNEYGSNTGRPRRIGWFDVVALKHSIRSGGISHLFITLLDVLDDRDEIKICTSYSLNGATINYFLATEELLVQCKPNYITLAGWKTDTTSVKTYHELPENAKAYLKKIAELCELNILGFSVGPDRTQTVMMENLFYD